MDALHECPLCKSPRLITAAIKGTVFVACRDCLALVEVNESTRFIVLVPPITTSPKD